MRLWRYLGPSLTALFVQKVRTILALSGVGVGVAAVVLSGAIGMGARQEVLRRIEQMGTNLLIIKPLQVKKLVARKTITGLATTLEIDDYEAIAALSVVAAAAPGVDGDARVKAGAVVMKTTIRGTTPIFPSVRRFRIASGRFFGTGDDQMARRVAVLGARVSGTLFGREQPVGREIRIRGVPFDVIGVLQSKGLTADGADEDNQVLVPIRTALRRIFNSTWLTTIYVSVESSARMSEAEAEIRSLLRERHRRGVGNKPDDFAIQDTTKMRAVQQTIAASLSTFATGLAVVALLVGGIGILALMLLSVRERTGEIGLRKAIGAQPRDILIQFTLEATVLALAGWAGGIVLGLAGAAAVALGTTWTVGVPVPAVVASLGMAVVIGVGFGALPARSASRMPPIQALVRE
jgi:putative ABC transport system permease protein